MKKLYLAAATFLSLSLSNAQSLTAVSSSQNILQNVKKPASVLYEQVATGGSGIVSSVLSNGNFVMAADDFILSGDAGVKTFSFLGFQNAGFTILRAFDIWDKAINNYNLNFSHPAELQDINQLSPDYLKSFSPDVIIGGSPCQDYSSAGKQDETLGRAN